MPDESQHIGAEAVQHDDQPLPSEDIHKHAGAESARISQSELTNTASEDPGRTRENERNHGGSAGIHVDQERSRHEEVPRESGSNIVPGPAQQSPLAQAEDGHVPQPTGEVESSSGQVADLFVDKTEDDDGQPIQQDDNDDAPLRPPPSPGHDSDEERPLVALLDDEERPLVALLDEEEVPLAALLGDAVPGAQIIDDDDDDNIPLDAHSNHRHSGPESLISGSAWTNYGSDFESASLLLDPNLRATLDALFQARVTPLVNHIHRLEAQVSHLMLAVSRVEGFLKAQGPQVQLGPGKFLATQEDPAEQLHRRMNQVINSVGMTNPGAITRKAELGAGLLADMPVRMNYLSNGDLEGGGIGGGGAAGCARDVLKPGAGNADAVLIKTGHANGPPATYTLATERVNCLQCKGRGWEHTNAKERHKAASPDSRCKKCSDCARCGGSGMRDGYTCRDCDASGQREENGVLAKCTTCNGEGITDTPPRAADISSTNKRRTILNENKRRTMLMGLVPSGSVGSGLAGFQEDDEDGIGVESQRQNAPLEQDHLTLAVDDDDEDIPLGL
ncbi:hypothetical protein HDU86_002217 [Geranomyces michiganensis]|nr:hypothetical protein HDU86_002217 [Geranomyces michiganensis]